MIIFIVQLYRYLMLFHFTITKQDLKKQSNYFCFFFPPSLFVSVFSGRGFCQSSACFLYMGQGGNTNCNKTYKSNSVDCPDNSVAHQECSWTPIIVIAWTKCLRGAYFSGAGMVQWWECLPPTNVAKLIYFIYFIQFQPSVIQVCGSSLSSLL